jgi:hypothetical protein
LQRTDWSFFVYRLGSLAAAERNRYRISKPSQKLSIKQARKNQPRLARRATASDRMITPRGYLGFKLSAIS